MRALIDETQSQDAKHGGGSGRDQLKLQLLQNELKDRDGDEVGFGTCLLVALEESRRDVGLQEDFLSHFCRAGKVSLKAQLALALAALKAGNETTRREGAKFLKAKLKEHASVGRGSPLPEALLHELLTTLRTPEVDEVFEEKDREAQYRQLIDMHPMVDWSRSALSAVASQQRMNPAKLAKFEANNKVMDVELCAFVAGDHKGARGCALRTSPRGRRTSDACLSEIDRPPLRGHERDLCCCWYACLTSASRSFGSRVRGALFIQLRRGGRGHRKVAHPLASIS